MPGPARYGGGIFDNFALGTYYAYQRLWYDPAEAAAKAYEWQHGVDLTPEAELQVGHAWAPPKTWYQKAAPWVVGSLLMLGVLAYLIRPWAGAAREAAAAYRRR